MITEILQYTIKTTSKYTRQENLSANKIIPVCSVYFDQDLRTALFWAISQRVVLIPYRRFGTNYRSHLQGSKTLDDGTDSLSRNHGKELPLHSVKHPRNAQFSSTSRRKPAILI